jgi:hypothetical protein
MITSTNLKKRSHYKYDLHVHTVESSFCAFVKAKEMVGLYKKAGYAGIMISDHYYPGYFDTLKKLSWEEKIDRFLLGYHEALAEGKNLGIKVLLGAEFLFSDHDRNHFLVFGLTEEFLKNNPKLYNLTQQEFKEFIKETDLLIYQAHPFRKGCSVVSSDLLDGIEIYNGNSNHDSFNQLAHQFAVDHSLRICSGSDFHHERDLAKGGVILEQSIDNSQELARLMKNDLIKEIITS